MPRRRVRLSGPVSVTLVAVSLLAVTLAFVSLPVRAPTGPHPIEGGPLTVGERTRTTAPAGPAAGFSMLEDGASPSAIGLNWTMSTVGTFLNYTILESPNGSAPWLVAQVILTASNTSFVVSGLTPGATYHWEITAYYNASGGGGIGSQTTTPLVAVQPTLADLESPASTATSVTLNWTNNATYGGLINFTSYAIYEWKTNTTPVVVWTGTNVSVNVTTISGLTPATGYSFYLLTTDCIAACNTTSPVVSVTQSNTLPVGSLESLSVTLIATHSVLKVGMADYFTCTPFGGKSPYHFRWDFGNGKIVPGISSESEVFSASGATTVTCQVTDGEPARAGGAVTISVLPTGLGAGVASAPLAPSEVIGVAAALGALVGLLFVEFRRRFGAGPGLTLPGRWIPPTDPNKIVGGSKVCGHCGTPNLPIRQTCRACGASLSRSPVR